MEPLLDLRGIGQLSVHDNDLAVWYSRPADPQWPIAKGRVIRDANGSLAIRLDVEEKLEWRYLHQHLPDDQIWPAIVFWKQAIAHDLAARTDLLREVVSHIERGLGLPIDMSMPHSGGERPAVGLAYAFALYDQLLSRSLGLRHGPVTRDAFRFISGLEETNTLHLANGPAIKYSDKDQKDVAIEFILKAQEGLGDLPKAKPTADAYGEAERATREVKKHVERLRLAVGFPTGSVCDACSNWVS